MDRTDVLVDAYRTGDEATKHRAVARLHEGLTVVEISLLIGASVEVVEAMLGE